MALHLKKKTLNVQIKNDMINVSKNGARVNPRIVDFIFADTEK